MHVRKTVAATSIAAVLLTIAAAFFVFESAGDEPFLRFQANQAWKHLVAATVVLVLWVELVVCTVALFLRHHRVAYAMTSLWGVFVLFWLAPVPWRYINDVAKFQIQQTAAGSECQAGSNREKP